MSMAKVPLELIAYIIENDRSYKGSCHRGLHDDESDHFGNPQRRSGI